MYGRRFIPLAKEANRHKLETMIVRKPTTKKMHPLVAKKLQKKLAPLPPLKYKLQELPNPDTTWNIPLGNTTHIPFFVTRLFWSCPAIDEITKNFASNRFREQLQTICQCIQISRVETQRRPL